MNRFEYCHPGQSTCGYWAKEKAWNKADFDGFREKDE
jgi:hypothetical protein